MPAAAGGHVTRMLRWLGIAVASMFTLVGITTLGIGSVRKQYVETLSMARAKVYPPTIVFIGDSITAGGMPWGIRVSSDPFSAVTFARGGFLAWQMKPFTEATTWGFTPTYVSYMAGSNDSGTDRISDGQSLADQLQNIDRLIATGSRVIVTLPPPVANLTQSVRLRRMGSALQTALAHRRVRIVNLWPDLADGGRIAPRFTVDGVHFTAAAYRIWASRLRQAMREHSRRRIAKV